MKQIKLLHGRMTKIKLSRARARVRKKKKKTSADTVYRANEIDV